MKNKDKGQSLVELITCVAMFTMVTFAALSLFGFVTNTYYKVLWEEEAQYEYRLFTYSISNTIKGADNYSWDGSQFSIYNGEEELEFSDTYVEGITDKIIWYNIDVNEGLVTIDFEIEVVNIKQEYQVKYMLPKEKE